ncbi:hypothetical protein GGF46_004979 [Coemansia sp. RSA 552]|nr:hypothetical protein GGF46_004979 [Coemansia sp. RSA 552]
MEPLQTETARVLRVLQGPPQAEHGAAAAKDAALGPSGPKPDIWSVPANAGPDLARPAILAEVVSQWPALDETQKINVLLGIAHVGLNRMSQAQAEARQVSELAKNDVSNDWVRTLGCLIGDVGVSGKMPSLQALKEPTQSEMASAVGQLSEALERCSMCLAIPELSYVSPAVAKSMAPANIRHIYGKRPSDKEVAGIKSQAKQRPSEPRSRASSRRQSVLQSPVRRASTHDPDGSASSSRLASPEPNNAEMAAFTDLFAGDSDSGGESMSEDDDGDGDGLPTGAANIYRLSMNVRSSHRADHVGRMARLLAAAESTPALAAAAGVAQKGSPADARRGMSPGARGGMMSRPGVRRGALGAAGVARKSSMFAPRKRGANAPMAPTGHGLGAAAATRREADGGAAIANTTKRIRMVNLDEAADAMDDRERLMQEKIDEKKRAAEERKRAAEEKKRVVEEKRRAAEEKRRATQEKKRAVSEDKETSDGAQPKRARRGKDADGSESPVDEAGSGNESSDSTSSDSFDIPLEYRTFNGNDKSQQAVYADTNVLSDMDRKIMYCFFKGHPMPKGVDSQVEILMNKRMIDDKKHPGKKCTEMIMFKADLVKNQWSKVRKLRR